MAIIGQGFTEDERDGFRLVLILDSLPAFTNVERLERDGVEYIEVDGLVEAYELWSNHPTSDDGTPCGITKEPVSADVLNHSGFGPCVEVLIACVETEGMFRRLATVQAANAALEKLETPYRYTETSPHHFELKHT